MVARAATAAPPAADWVADSRSPTPRSPPPAPPSHRSLRLVVLEASAAPVETAARAAPAAAASPPAMAAPAETAGPVQPTRAAASTSRPELLRYGTPT